MIQLNLLPDIKLEYIKAERSRRMVFTISLLVTGAAVALLILLLSFDGLQKKHLNDLSKDINKESSELRAQPQIGKILTVQNQLKRLTDLHNAKPAVARAFDYLNQVTPSNASITNLHVDLNAHTIEITGTADALSSVNKYVDTLKFTTYTTDKSDSKGKPFTSVVLTSFGLNTASQDQSKAANFTIDLSYDPNIFDTTQKVTLSVPNIVTTRSQLDKPTDLFTTSPKPTPTGVR